MAEDDVPEIVDTEIRVGAHTLVWLPWHAVVDILSLRSDGTPLSTPAGSWNTGAASGIHG